MAVLLHLFLRYSVLAVRVSGECSVLSLCDENHTQSTRQASILSAAKHRSAVCQLVVCRGGWGLKQGSGPLVRDTTVTDLSIKRNALP